MKHFVRDALNAALQKLAFPWLTPHPTKTGVEVGYFQKTISKADLYEMYKRNQLAHNIVFDVAYDCLSGGFEITTLDGEENKELNAPTQKLYASMIHQPLLKAYLFARLYGSGGILIGYRDTKGFEKVANNADKIDYLFAIPNTWIRERVGEKDDVGNTVIPPNLAKYVLSNPSVDIDASRIVHLQPLSIEEGLDGESCLHHIFDVLTVLKNMDWSSGQAMFRHGAGLTTIVAGEGANQLQIDAIDEATSNINTKTVITLPPGCSAETHKPSALDPEKYYYVIVSQIAGGANIPLSILIGAPKGALQSSAKDRKDYADFLAGIQNNVLAPILIKILKKFQDSEQLPRGEFLIKWKTPSIFIIDASRGELYSARAETEKAKAEKLRAETKEIEKRFKGGKEKEG